MDSEKAADPPTQARAAAGTRATWILACAAGWCRRFGRREEMLAFGRKCQETKNWAGRIPFMLVAAHYDAAEYSEKGAWLRQPEVWAELQLFFENYLKEHPEAKFERAKYAKCAFDCERFEDADRLFAHLGEFDWVDVFDSAQAYQDARAEVQRRLTGAR